MGWLIQDEVRMIEYRITVVSDLKDALANTVSRKAHYLCCFGNSSPPRALAKLRASGVGSRLDCYDIQRWNVSRSYCADRNLIERWIYVEGTGWRMLDIENTDPRTRAQTQFVSHYHKGERYRTEGRRGHE